MMISNVMIHEYVEISNTYCTVIYSLIFFNDKATHSIPGSWQSLNVKERKDKTLAFEIKHSCFLKAFYPCVQFLK